jgi:hypothetical protein
LFSTPMSMDGRANVHGISTPLATFIKKLEEHLGILIPLPTLWGKLDKLCK